MALTLRGVTYDLTFDEENRVTAVKQGTTTIGSFAYDADGNRVKGTVNGVTTSYVGGVFEWQSGATTKYYDGGAIRRTGYAANNGILYVLSDQLGSTSVIVGQNGSAQATSYYFPFGGNRGGSAFSDLTTKRFTGQYHESALPGGEGLSYYNARWYDPQLGRFVSPDTLIPNPANPQHFNRFAYVSNNPINRTDPTGHYEACDDGVCRGRGDQRHGVPIQHPRRKPGAPLRRPGSGRPWNPERGKGIGRSPARAPWFKSKPVLGASQTGSSSSPFIGPVQTLPTASDAEWDLEAFLDALQNTFGWTLDGSEHEIASVEMLAARYTYTYQVSLQQGAVGGSSAYLHQTAVEGSVVTVTPDGIHVVVTPQAAYTLGNVEASAEAFYGVERPNLSEYREVLGTTHSYQGVHKGRAFALQVTVTTKVTRRPWVPIAAVTFAASAYRCATTGMCQMQAAPIR